jgi:hypothetical protein
MRRAMHLTPRRQLLGRGLRSTVDAGSSFFQDMTPMEVSAIVPEWLAPDEIVAISERLDAMQGE